MSIILMSEVGGKPSIKEEGLEEGGGKGDCDQKKGWEVGGHHLAYDLPLHDNNHTKSLFASSKVFVAQFPFSDPKDGHIYSLGHDHLVWDQSHSGNVQTSHGHVDEAGLKRMF